MDGSCRTRSPRDRFTRAPRLSFGEAAAPHATMDEDVDPGARMAWGKAHMVGCALVAEMRGGGQGGVNREWRASAKMRRRLAKVSGASKLRWSIDARFAVIR
jgi:hypothetical protein